MRDLHVAWHRIVFYGTTSILPDPLVGPTSTAVHVFEYYI